MTGRPLHLLLLADTLTATQQIAFIRPLADASDAIALHVECASALWADEDHVDAVWQAQLPDVVVLSRCMVADARRWIDRARRDDVPLVYHIDDDLLAIPPSVGPRKFAFYNEPDRLHVIRSLMDDVDLVYTSTAGLADAVASYAIRPAIHAGRLSCSAGPEGPRRAGPSTMPTLGYMATGGHNADLAAVLPAIERLLEDIPALRFETFGSVEPPAALARFGARVAHHGAVKDYDSFMATLAGLGWWVGIAPLVDNRYNRCKSDIKWLEYAQCGVAPVVQSIEVYARAIDAGGAVACLTVDDWYDAASRLLASSAARFTLLRAARLAIHTGYRHRSMTDQIGEMIAHAIREHAHNRAG